MYYFSWIFFRVSLIRCSAYVYMKEHSTQYCQRTRNKGLLLPASIYRYTVMLLAKCLRQRKSVLRVSKGRHFISLLKAPRLDKNKGIYMIQKLLISKHSIFVIYFAYLIMVSIKYIMALVSRIWFWNRCVVRSLYK